MKKEYVTVQYSNERVILNPRLFPQTWQRHSTTIEIVPFTQAECESWFSIPETPQNPSISSSAANRSHEPSIHRSLLRLGSSIPNRINLHCNLTFSITPNLHEAFLALRKTDEYQTLWIDQICINQDDIYEKTEQTKRMGEIYRNAERTIAWLGDCPEPMLGQNVFDIVPVLREALTSLPGLEMRMKIGEHSGLAALTVLFSVPWFSRVWIIQETVLSKSLTLRWGKQEFVWNDIAELVYLL
jgi:hypothetical protein